MWLKIKVKKFSHHFLYIFSSFILANGNAAVEAMKKIKQETSRSHISSVTVQSRNAVKNKSLDLDLQKYWGIKKKKEKKDL